MPEQESEPRRSRAGSARPRKKAGKSTASRPRAEHSGGADAFDAGHACSVAARYTRELTGRRPEGVTSFEHGDEGWQVGIEVVESRKIPDSMDILALYRVRLDQEGELVSCRRERRYYRGRVEGDPGE